MMNLIRKIYDRIRRKHLLVKPVVNTCFFGHKWSDDKTKQICLNNGCNATRILMYNKYPKIGEPAMMWHYYNIDDLDLK